MSRNRALPTLASTLNKGGNAILFPLRYSVHITEYVYSPFFFFTRVFNLVYYFFDLLLLLLLFSLSARLV